MMEITITSFILLLLFVCIKNANSTMGMVNFNGRGLLKMLSLKYVLIFGFLFCSSISFSQATFRSNVTTGNWTASGSWTLNSGSDADGVPDANDNVQIRAGHTITVNTTSGACASLIVGNNNGTANLTFSGTTSQLTVSGTVNIGDAPNGNSRIGVITFISGSTLICNALNLSQGNATNRLVMSANSLLRTGALAIVGTGGTTPTWTPSTGTVEMTASDTLPTTVFTSFNNLTISNGTTTAGVGFSVGGVLSIASGTTLNMSTFAMTGASLTTSGTGTLRTQNTSSTPLPTGRTWSPTVQYDGAGAQTLVVGTYSDITLAGTRAGTPTITLGNGTIGVSGTFNVTYTGTVSFTNTGSTVNFSSASSQTIPSSVNFRNITNTGNGARVLASSGTISIAGALTPGTGIYTNTGSTVLLNGTSGTTALTLPTVSSGNSFNVLRISASGATYTLPASASVQNLANTLNMQAGTFVLNPSTNSTIINTVAVGTINISGGTIDDRAGIAGLSTTLKVATAWNQTGGLVTNTSADGINEISFDSGATSTYNGLTATANFIYWSFKVTNNTQVTLNTNLAINGITGTQILFVELGSELTAGTFVITHGATFVAGSGFTIDGVLKTANLNGFSGSTTTALNTVTNTPVITLGASSLIEYNATSTQVVSARTDYANVTFTGGSKTMPTGTTTLSKTLTINTGATYNGTTNNPVLNIGGNFSNSGTFNQGTGLLTFTNGGAANTISGSTATTFNEVTLNNSNGLLLNTDATIDTTLTLTSGRFDIGSKILTFGSTANAVAGTLNSSNMIIADGGGEVRKSATSNASAAYTFPIGDSVSSSDGADFSPISLTVTGSAYSSAYVSVSLNDSKHPNNSSTTNYLTRYWNVSQSGITDCTSTVTGTYINAVSDVAGTLGSIKAAQLNGTFNVSSNPWVKTGGDVFSGTTLTYTGAILTAGQTSSFTGITEADPTVSITGGDVSVCKDYGVTLTANATGDGTITYSWTGLITGSTTSDSATADTSVVGGPNSYTVTVKDANGISSAVSTAATVTITALPVAGTLSASPSVGAVCSGTSVSATLTSGTGGSGTIADELEVSLSGGAYATYTSGASINTTGETSVTIRTKRTATGSGCTASGYNSVTWTVDPNIPVSVNIGATATTICSGTSVTFTATPTNGGTTPSYQWKVNGSNVGTDSATYTSTTLANGNAVTVEMTSNASLCLTGSPATSNTVTMTVNASPSASIVSNNGPSICSGSDAVFTISGTTADVITYNLNGASNTTATLTGSSMNIIVNGVTTAQTFNLVSVSNGTCSTSINASSSVTLETTIWNGSIWDNGLPNSSKAVVFTGDYTMTSDFSACSISVSGGAVVSIDSGKNVSLYGGITVASGSSFILNTNANLYQSDASAVNTGNIIVRRDSNPLIRLDYTMWSSPVEGQKLLAFSPLTSMSPTIRFYTYNTTTNFYNSVASPSTTDFATGKGYLIRLPYNHPTVATVWNGAFTGVPNNGTKTVTLSNIDETHQYNAVGNPYPSPISVSQFASDNASNIEPTIYFWRKTNNDANPSYCTWNSTSQTFGSNGESYSTSPNGIIHTGQGFIVEAKGSATSLVFNNGQRVVNNTNHFLKSSNAPATSTTESHRIWLNLTGAGTEYSQAVVGYFTNATQGADDYDSKLFNDGSIALSTKIGTSDYVIQGRPAPFDASDVVPLNFKVTTSGTYTFAIDHVDGLFTAGAQEVYIKDNLDGSYHNITTTPYSFASAAGTFSNRFELVYQNLLSSNAASFTANSIVVYHQQNDVVINTGSATMSSVKVYDIRGRLLVEKKDINTTETRINVGTTNQVLLVQVTTTEGLKATKKVVN